MNLLLKVLGTAIVKKIAIAVVTVLVERTDSKVDDRILKLVLES